MAFHVVVWEPRLLLFCDSNNLYTSESFTSIWQMGKESIMKPVVGMTTESHWEGAEGVLEGAVPAVTPHCRENNFGGQLASHMLHSDIKKNISLKARPST